MNTAEPTGGVPLTLEVSGVTPLEYEPTSPWEHPGEPENSPAGGGAVVSQGGENVKLTPVAVTKALPELMLTVPITVAEAVLPMTISDAARTATAEPRDRQMLFVLNHVSVIKTVLSSLLFAIFNLNC